MQASIDRSMHLHLSHLSERVCVLTSLVNMILWCNSMVQHRMVHGSFLEPLQNADATDVSILQTMHVKHGLQNSASALPGKKALCEKLEFHVTV